MNDPLFSLQQAPQRLPVWHLILQDLCNPPAAGIARVLGVSPRTVYRWSADDSAPRVASLALFQFTSWGHSRIEAHAINSARVALGLADSLKRENEKLRTQVEHLNRLGQFHSANSPLIG